MLYVKEKTKREDVTIFDTKLHVTFLAMNFPR